MTKVFINFNVIKNIFMPIISHLNKYVTSASFILANTYYFFNLLFYIYSKIINMHLSFKFLRETPRKRVLSINPGNYLLSEKHREISPRNTAKFRADDFVYLAYFAVFLREIKISRLPWLRRNAEYVVIFLPGVYFTTLDDM